MLISDSLNCNPPMKSRGFTLIEILVVLLIVTIMTGLVVARLPAMAASADIDREARRLELLLRMARSEAILDSFEYGFKVTRAGYLFQKFDDQSQAWVEAEPPLHERELDDDIRLSLRAESADYALLGERLPPVLILSSGELTPFRITLTSADGEIVNLIEGKLFGEITRIQDREE